jgi:phosphoenolpyruvate-protein kinase (PTS system EI component)
MSERRLRGLAAVGGIAVGCALVLREATDEEAGAGGEEAQRSALDALARVAAELDAAAERLRAQGLGEEADILDANALIARDPGLIEAARSAAAEVSAAAAVRCAAETQASTLESLLDPLLAARGADVREIGRRAARILAGRTLEHADGQSILIARDLGPADVADLQLGAGPVAGIALAFGAVTSHAAIMARALGVPMVVALGPALLDAEGGDAVLDGDDGTVVLDPAPATIAAARGRVREREDQLFELRRARGLPAETRDGTAVRLLCNAGTETEVVAGLAAGAEGIGLLRTELAFSTRIAGRVKASTWQHWCLHSHTSKAASQRCGRSISEATRRRRFCSASLDAESSLPLPMRRRCRRSCGRSCGQVRPRSFACCCHWWRRPRRCVRRARSSRRRRVRSGGPVRCPASAR